MNEKNTSTEQIVREKIDGVIERFIFKSEETGFAVFVLTHPKNSSVTVTGTFHGITAGQEVQLSGVWRMHKKFGKQFEAMECQSILPTTVDGLKKYLGSGLIKGIGKVYAEKLVERFGLHVLSVIDKTPERLLEVSGIGTKRAEQIGISWADQKEVARIMVFLQEKGVSPGYATKIYKQYRDQAIEIVQENPYRLADDIWGISFKIADQIAQKIGIHAHSPHRLHAALLFGISQGTKVGHLYQEFTALITKTRELLLFNEAEDQVIQAAFDTLHSKGKVLLLQDNGVHYATAPQYYHTEQFIAQKLRAVLVHPSFITSPLMHVSATIADSQRIELNAEQQRGIHTCLKNKVTIITGGPGTGKTTLIKKLLSILDENKLTYRLAAPTGRAAKRITQGTGKLALTIHRLLEFDVASRGFSHNEQNALQLDFLIIDEASMIDIFLAQAVLKAMPYQGHLILIGDVDQLPSVGAGNFLNDLIQSKKITTIRLTQIFRQAQDSLIIVNAHKVNNGEFPVSSLPDAKKDFIFIKENDPTMVQKHLDELLLKYVPRTGIPAQDAMVLVPMNRGIVGTQQINIHLQKLLNSANGEGKNMSYGLYRYTVGDRVMQIRNNYDKAVFNGDTGIIDDINISDKVMLVRYYDRIVEYEQSELDELVLAYAISIHKSQGSEYPAVIIPIFMQHFTLLQRNLIYTAITRAKKLCILIGQPKAIAMAIKNNKGIERTTFLTDFLTSSLQAR